ncbi:DUF5953 family protein [Myxococcus sp. RHSTA-1-4]|uniref:DUF5953 family protein n=1 Tax=Myxococcus sp. RHSTA-1-4 TaxID=2874601 RepID=UPI001CBDAA6C|nr:DUF5953 family protein [Myxococcus sp. RHSTA-1-4]MBZ4423190.1 DUF5953 family protein [Myxococcus sp. RHSTA-1-4]
MPTPQDDIGLIVYAPELVGNDGRSLAVVHGMERAFPGLRLGWTTSEEGQRTLLANRDAWLAQQTFDGEFPLLHNGNMSDYVSVSGWAGSATSSSGGQAQLEVHARLSLTADAIAAAADVLEAIAEAAHAFWGHATPFNASVEISRQTVDPLQKPGVPPRGLPALKFPEHIRSPEIPQYLGWLNYWSAASSRALRFPDPSRDADLLSRARHTASDGWIVRLTDAPLDLDNPAHLDALLRAYERFPEIGGRSST